MSERTVEIANLSIKVGLDLSVGEAKTAWEYTLNTIAKQPGLKSMYWGFQIEHPDIIQMVVEWDSVASHKAFIADPEYQPFLANLDEYILASPPSIVHADLAPNRSTTNPFTMPVTECLRAYLPADYPSATYAAQFADFEDAAAVVPDVQAKGILGGWSQEPVTHEKLGKGVEGRMFVVFIGWPDVQAHEDFRKTEYYGPVVNALGKGVSAMDVVHMQFKRVV